MRNPFYALNQQRPVIGAVGITAALCLIALSNQDSNQTDHQELPLSPLALAGFSLIPRRKKQSELDQLKHRQQELEHRNQELAAELLEAQRDLDRAEAEISQFKRIHFASLQRFQTLFNELPLPCFTVNEIGHVMEWNRASVAFFGLEPYQVIDQPIANILGEDVYRGHAQENIYQVFLGHHPDPAIVNVSRRNGDPQKVKWITSPVKNQQGQVVGAVNTLGILPAAQSDGSSKEEKKVA